MERDQLRILLDKAYEKTPPWDSPGPPEQLVNLIGGGVPPCAALDVGCGLGQNSFYLASKGFKVLGIDFSENAVRMAQSNAVHHGKTGKACHFLICDVLEIENRIEQTFGFCLEWGLLHFIAPAERPSYLRQLASVLSPGALYLSLCFNEQSCEWGGAGKRIRTSPLTGAEVHYSSAEDLEELYRPYFCVVSKDVVDMRFRGSPDVDHLENLFLLQRK